MKRRPIASDWTDRIRGARLHYVWNDLYEFGVFIIHPCNEELLRAACDKHGFFKGGKALDNMNVPPLGAYYVTDGDKNMIAFGMKRPTPNVIAHECFHVVHTEFSARGILLDGIGGEEAYAHLLGWLVKQVGECVK